MNDATSADRLQQIRKLTEVSRAVTYAASLDEVFQITVDHAAALFEAGRSMLLVTGDDGLLILRSSHGVDPALARSIHEPLDEALVPRLARLLDAPPGDVLGVPLVAGGKVKGVLVVIRAADQASADQDEWILSALADQAALALEKTRLGEIGEFREQLIGIVGHDLRNPLSTITMAARALVLCEGLGERETELARKITRSASQAVRLIDQLLDLTRSRLGGGIPIEPRRMDLGDVARQVVGETELTHPERALCADVRGDVTGVWDPDRMYQIVANLVGNAVRHGAARSPIDLRVEGTEKEVVLEVANWGAPIPPETLPFIFDAFRQGRTAHAAGLGLGLFIVRQIARAHRGEVSVTSSANEGTTFRVRLPRSGAAATT